MYLTVTIDTEEDNWGEYDRPAYSVRNVGRIPRLQELFEKRGIRPTYLISYPVATSSMAIEVLGRYLETGACEIGTHPHPWNTPPLEEARTPFNSYMSNLPPGLQYQKIKTLHEAIARNFGSAPTTYRSGRWGFSDVVAANLIRVGYTVDTSVSPVCDWSEDGGPDYSDRTHHPYMYRLDGAAAAKERTLLEVPATIDFIQSRRRIANAAYWAIARASRQSDKVLAALGKLRVLNHVALSPELQTARNMIRLAEKMLERGVKVLNMFFHSPSLLENCSPFVQTADDVARFFGRIDEFIAFAQSARLQSVTMSQLQAAAVGAATVKVLPGAAHD